MFTNKLAQYASAISVCMLSGLTQAADSAAHTIRELKNDDIVKEVSSEFDFTVVSFYKPSDEKSVEIDGFMEGAQAFFNKQIKSGDYDSRNVGWLRVDIENNPDIKMSDSPDQLVMTKSGLHRLVHFAKVSEEPSKNHETFAAIVRELTGDWVLQLDCEKIQNDKRFYYDEVVFFGSEDELKEGGKVAALTEASMVDRYQFDEQRTGFFFNEDPLCRKDRGLDENKPFIVWYNGENSIPYIIEINDTPIDMHRLMYETTIRSVNGTPRWGSRANSAIFDFYQNGLIYMMPEMLEPQEMMDDWRVMLAVRIVEMTQENDTSFVPLIVPFQQEPADRMMVPQLSNLLGIEKDELPNFYALHPFSDQVVAYPETLDKPENFSPEMILLWARRTVLYLEIELFEQEIAAFEERVAKGDEEIAEWETEKNERAKTSLKSAQEEQAIVMEKLEAVTEKVQANQNEFAEKLDEHKDVSHDHISRVQKDETQPPNEEL